MSTVLAAIDGSPISRAVLDVAKEVARVLDADVDAVHVVEGEGPPGRGRDPGRETPLRLLSGEPSSVLVAEASAGSVAAIVVGSCRAVGAPTPPATCRSTSSATSAKPVVVVPPRHARGLRAAHRAGPGPGQAGRARSRRSCSSPRTRSCTSSSCARSTSCRSRRSRISPTTTCRRGRTSSWRGGSPAPRRTPRWRCGSAIPRISSSAVTQEVCADIVAIGRRRGVPDVGGAARPRRPRAQPRAGRPAPPRTPSARRRRTPRGRLGRLAHRTPVVAAAQRRRLEGDAIPVREGRNRSYGDRLHHPVPSLVPAKA